MTKTVELKVGMTCGGCVGAVERVLKKTQGVESFNVDLDQQKVTVVGDLDPQFVLEKVAKTGKPTSFWTG